MAEDKSFLQKIKLDISKNFKLTPYERLAFHKIFGITLSTAGQKILIDEIDLNDLTRLSAVSILSRYTTQEATDNLIPFLERPDVLPREALYILNHIALVNTETSIPAVISFIEKYIDVEGFRAPVARAFSVLASVGTENEEVMSFILNIINNNNDEHGFLAISTLSAFRIISHYENLLKTDDLKTTHAVFSSLYFLSIRILELMANSSEEENLFTYSPEQEDKIILDMRVLLGKQAHRFEEFSNDVKVLFISIMMTSNHREFLIFAMKALTSNDRELIYMTLAAIHKNITRLRDPDKLFRNLISLSTETNEENHLIVSIFIKFFSLESKSRTFHLLRDKLYSYIVVTTETYFETYRKEFMITGIAEKNYPENFQLIRSFILKRFTSEVKKKLINHLEHDSPNLIKHILSDMNSWVYYINDKDIDTLNALFEILIDDDAKSRKNSAKRLEDINFEKRYLTNRLLRLFEIIASLQISEAASPLINMYNYLKKYPDQKIFDAVVTTLSILNYSYMLGELEVQLTTGGEKEQLYALNNLALYSEQRSLNILFEFLQHHTEREDKVISKILEILINRDITHNVTAQQLLHTVISKNKNQLIVKLAVTALGHCKFSDDITFMHSLCLNDPQHYAKEEIVRSMGMNIPRDIGNAEKKQLMKIFHHYLKEPGIRIRIYASYYLTRLGNEEAIRSIRDMLVIKNKSIQRDILTILGNLQSQEFSFFLLSLLTEEYGIVNDILPVLKLLPEEHLREIDGFVANIFRKFEAPSTILIDDEEKKPKEKIVFEGVLENSKTLLTVALVNHDTIYRESNFTSAINLKLLFKEFILSVFEEQHGTISFITPTSVTAMFANPAASIEAARNIRDRVLYYNQFHRYEKRINLSIQVMTDTIHYLNDELIEFPQFRELPMVPEYLYNKIVIDSPTAESITGQFHCLKLPNYTLFHSGCFYDHFEVTLPINFHEKTTAIYESIVARERERQIATEQLEDELKKLQSGFSESNSPAVTRQLEDIGSKLQDSLNEIEKYVQRRSTDRELLRNVRTMLNNVYNQYKVEISRIIIK